MVWWRVHCVYLFLLTNLVSEHSTQQVWWIWPHTHPPFLRSECDPWDRISLSNIITETTCLLENTWSHATHRPGAGHQQWPISGLTVPAKPRHHGMWYGHGKEPDSLSCHSGMPLTTAHCIHGHIVEFNTLLSCQQQPNDMNSLSRWLPSHTVYTSSLPPWHSSFFSSQWSDISQW